MAAMRDSPPGDDEVTVGMLRAAGGAVQDWVGDIVARMSRTPPVQWVGAFGPEPFRAIQILLYKNEAARGDLGNYRGICLISDLSRILAKVVQMRLAAWAEAAGVHPHEQWGNHSSSSTRDEIFVARAMFDEATRAGRPPGAGALCLSRFDIMKAFLSVSRAVLRDIWLRVAFVASFADLIVGIRTPAWDSTVYRLRRGVREGRPTSGVCSTLFQRRDDTCGEVQVVPGAGAVRLEAALAAPRSSTRPPPRGVRRPRRFTGDTACSSSAGFRANLHQLKGFVPPPAFGIVRKLAMLELFEPIRSTISINSIS